MNEKTVYLPCSFPSSLHFNISSTSGSSVLLYFLLSLLLRSTIKSEARMKSFNKNKAITYDFGFLHCFFTKKNITAGCFLIRNWRLILYIYMHLFNSNYGSSRKIYCFEIAKFPEKFMFTLLKLFIGENVLAMCTFWWIMTESLFVRPNCSFLDPAIVST